jgi:hypothetical protein
MLENVRIDPLERAISILYQVFISWADVSVASDA